MPNPIVRDTQRRARHVARSMLWRGSGLPRVRACGLRPFSDDQPIVVKASGAGDERRAGWGGLQTCGSVWACPVCSEKVNRYRQAEVTDALTTWEAAGGSILFATLTISHREGQSLRSVWDRLGGAWRLLTNSRYWRRLRASGVAEHYIRCVEVTKGANGWHVHAHVLLFGSPGMAPLEPDDVGILEGSLAAEWARQVEAVGSWVSPAYGVDVRRSHAAAELAAYFTKATFHARAAYEVTGAYAKRAGRGRTPFQILAAVMGSADSEPAADFDLWRQWERASKGRRQLVWSRGLRDRLALARELTDQEISDADDLAGEVVATVPAGVYRLIVARRLTARVLEWAEADDTGAILAVQLQGLHHAGEFLTLGR